MVNDNLSVITVTYNNAENLRRTLGSICSLITKPVDIIVIDGGSIDDTKSVVSEFQALLPVKFFSEPDDGIYDAMNKGLAMITTSLVHYLNAGDTVCGDPYSGVKVPALLPVLIIDGESGEGWFDYLKLLKYGYCHQGIIFPSAHRFYDTNFDLAADFKLICQTFPGGLDSLPRVNNGFVKYPLGGISSIYAAKGEEQILTISRKTLGIIKFIRLYVAIKLKALLPRPARRAIAIFVRGGCSVHGR